MDVVKAVFRSDIPCQAWLDEKHGYAREDGLNRFGVPKTFGPITGSFNRPILVAVDTLTTIPGQRDEQQNVRQESLDYLRDNWDEVSKELPYVEVDPFGRAWISEGNHRIMVAKEKGLVYLAADVRYFSGGDRFAHPDIAPEALIENDLKFNIALDKKDVLTRGVTMDIVPPGWRDIQKEDDHFDPWGYQLYKSMYELQIGGGGIATCGLTILKQGDKYLAAHGSVIMKASESGLPKEVDSLGDAATLACDWAVNNGWSMADVDRAIQREIEAKEQAVESKESKITIPLAMLSFLLDCAKDTVLKQYASPEIQDNDRMHARACAIIPSKSEALRFILKADTAIAKYSINKSLEEARGLAEGFNSLYNVLDNGASKQCSGKILDVFDHHFIIESDRTPWIVPLALFIESADVFKNNIGKNVHMKVNDGLGKISFPIEQRKVISR